MGSVSWFVVCTLAPFGFGALCCVVASVVEHVRAKRLHPYGRRRLPTDFTATEATAVPARVVVPEHWFDLDEAVLCTDFEAWADMPSRPHPTDPPLPDNDREEV